jgi:hypothetical protein
MRDRPRRKVGHDEVMHVLELVDAAMDIADRIDPLAGRQGRRR